MDSSLSEKVRDNGHNLEHGKFWLEIRKNFFTTRVVKHWKRMPSGWISILEDNQNKIVQDSEKSCLGWP